MHKRLCAGELLLRVHPIAIYTHGESMPAVPTEEARLMAGIRARNIYALEALYRHYHPLLTRFLMKRIPRPQLVEEVFNDTMMLIWDKPESFRGASRLSTWIFAIAYRKALKSLRRRGELVDDTEICNGNIDEPSPDELVRRDRVRLLLWEAISQLTADHRAVIQLCYFHDKGYREIAEIMGCPVNTVKTRMFHAKHQLRQILKGDLAEWL
jgi:RNA polymerase sigma factor (sigma-70 family)